MNKYILIGGNPFTGYTGTQTFTSLKVVGSSNTEEGIKDLWIDKYDECGGLMLILDAETGKDATEVLWPKELIEFHKSHKEVSSLADWEHDAETKYSGNLMTHGDDTDRPL